MFRIPQICLRGISFPVLCMIAGCALASTSGWSQQLGPALPPALLRTSLDLSFTEFYDSERESGNLLAASFRFRTGGEWKMGPVQLKGGFSTRLGISYVEGASADNRVRIGENELFAEFGIIVPVGWLANPYMAATVRTPVTEHFSYYQSGRIRRGTFWDPVRTHEGSGLALSLGGLAGRFNSRVGIGALQIRARSSTFMTDDRETESIVETYRTLSGIEHVTDGYVDLDSGMSCDGRLEVFGSFDDLTIWRARFEGNVQFRFWRFLAFTWNMGITQDIDESPRTQFRQSIAFGLGHVF